MHCDGTHRERKVKVVLETAGGERWTMRHQRQATLGKRSKSWPKTEGDGGQFPWTYAPQGVKGNKLSCIDLDKVVMSRLHMRKSGFLFYLNWRTLIGSTFGTVQPRLDVEAGDYGGIVSLTHLPIPLRVCYFSTCTEVGSMVTVRAPLKIGAIRCCNRSNFSRRTSEEGVRS